MKEISVPPGGFVFRLIAIVILMAILMNAFFSYTNKISIATEKTSIQQTKNIINSTLAVMFANSAIEGELDRLNQLVGANPFSILNEFNLLPVTYNGEIRVDDLIDIAPGWYYDRLNGLTIYKTFYDDLVYYFTIELSYRDVDGSGKFEAGNDEFKYLTFKQLPQP